ncbi:ABC transporter ATP-binding protein [bacterium LRH843]|nr:ABC transporter ATP-binding protein [bacterium LRH843]
MAMILSFLKRYRLPIWIALSLMLVELLVELFLPFLLAKIIDEGIMLGDLSVILRWGSVMVVMSLLSFLAGVLNAFYAAHVSQSTGLDLRNSLFNKIQSFSFANLQQFQASSLITRMTNDVTQVQSTIYMSLGIMMRAPLRVIGGTVMAFVVHAKLALILLATLPFLIVFLIWMKRKGSSLFRQVQQKLDGVNHVIRENLIAMRLIRVFVREKYETKRFNKSNEELMNRTVTVLRLMELTMPIFLLIMNAAIIGILWFGHFTFHSGGAQVGEVVAIVNYTLRITSALTVFSVMITVFFRAQASMKRIEEVLEADVDSTDAANPARETKIMEGTVEFKHVSFHYPNSKELAVEDCSFTVKAGERLVVMGETGSGKTSLFQLIPRLYEASSGNILIDGSNIRERDVVDLRSQIGYVLQEVILFSGSVKKNIAWGKNDATMADIIEAAKAAQIHETIMKLPKQYETKIGQKGVNLSGGQKQRLAIARALIRKPKILLLDDSTSALDVQTEEKFLEALGNYSSTTLQITQKISTAMDADVLLLMDEGKIAAIGTHEQLLKESPLYGKIYHSQYVEGDVTDGK